MKKTILLVRHAESVGNVRGYVTGTLSDELSDKGVLQATALRNKLDKLDRHRIFSSSAVRTIQTAKLCGFENPTIIPHLNETDGGQWAAQTLTKFNKQHPHFFSSFDPDRPYPNGESHTAMSYRVLNAFSALLAEVELSAIIFLHLGPINAILHNLLDMPLKTFPLFQVPHCGLIGLDVSVLTEKPKLLKINIY